MAPIHPPAIIPMTSHPAAVACWLGSVWNLDLDRLVSSADDRDVQRAGKAQPRWADHAILGQSSSWVEYPRNDRDTGSVVNDLS